MAFDKFLNKAKDLANDPKTREKLNSEKAEKVTDSILDKAAGVAESLTGGKHSDKIQKARDAADRAVGTDKAEGTDKADGPDNADGRSEGERGENDRGASGTDDTQVRSEGERKPGSDDSRP